jgi:error-prone DNA polymerase
MLDRRHPRSFTHLTVHSEYSLLSGLPSIPDLVARAKALGFKALALTDNDRMGGLILFYEACREAGLRPILGATLTDLKQPQERVTLLARDATGYGDLCELITRRHLHADFSLRRSLATPWPHLNLVCHDLDLLRALAQGPNRARLHGGLLRRTGAERLRSRAMEAFCDAQGLPAIASGEAHFLDKTDHALHRLVRAMDLNSTLPRLRPGEFEPEDAWLMPETRMRELFDDRPEALEAAARLAEDCVADPPVGQWIMPRIEVPAGTTPEERLAEVAHAGLRQRYAGSDRFAEALKLQEMELQVIGKLGYASYFLMVREVREAAGKLFGAGYRQPHECTLLRGSAANSITLYNLGASDLDPLEHDLYFYRFLNEDRASPPDADLDFGWDEREGILEWMAERFGRDRVAITCTTNRFRYRSAFREIAKVLGYSEAQVTEVIDPPLGARHKPDDDEVRRIGALALRLHGKPHFLGQHPGGVLVTNEPIWRHVACERSGGSKNRIITQIDMHSGIDSLGLIKFDLLGNGSLSVFRDTLEQLRRQNLPDPPVHDLQACCDDARVKAMMARGRTRGIFYIESPAQIRLNQKCQAETFAEITVTSSLVRPAGTAYARTYVERHRKQKENVSDWDFLHPSLAKVLGETHDVCAFQEDVTKICHEVAGLSFKQADQVRKMMNSQHEGAPATATMRALEQEFKLGCRKPRADGSPGLTAPQADELWTRVASFTGFSFCKSHSASYAQLSFRCAWLKAYYPSAFLSAVISNNHGFYTREVYIDEARRWGLDFLPLDVNVSEWKFRDEGGAIRPGFLHLSRFTEWQYAAIAEERERRGPFAGFDDFLHRVPAGRQEIENLILVGAFDAFGLSQPQLLYQLHGTPRRQLRDGGLATDLFHGSADAHAHLRKLGSYSLLLRCLHEERLLGYMLSADPVDVLALHPFAQGAVLAEALPRHKGQRVRILGRRVTERTHWIAKSGRLMHFLTLADRSGMIDVIFWPEQLERWQEVLAQSASFEVTGKVSEDWGTFSLEAERVRPAAFMPNLVDFEKASRRLRETGPSCRPYEDIAVVSGDMRLTIQAA